MMECSRTVIVIGAIVAALAVKLATPVHADEYGEPDPAEPHERWVLFTAGGPIILQWTLTIDGQPYRLARERLVRQLMQPTDGGQELSRRDAERVAAGRGAIEPLSVDAPWHAGPHDPRTVRAWLDEDNDGRLTFPECDDAFARLMAADAGQDELVSCDELRVRPMAPAPESARARTTVLAPIRNERDVLRLLADYYGDGCGNIPSKAIPLAPGLFVALDADLSDRLEPDEQAGIKDHRPHLEVAAHFGRTGDLLRGAHVAAVSPELGAADHVRRIAEDHTSIRLEGVTIHFQARASGANCDEHGPQRNEYFLSCLTLFQRVYSDPLFGVLDEDVDGQLSKRELHSAPRLLRALDTNSDAQVGSEETPQTMILLFAHGHVPLGPLLPTPLSGKDAE